MPKELLFLLAFVFLAAGCETSFEVSLPEHEPLLVLNGVLVADQSLTAHVSRSSVYGQPAHYDVPDATVFVYRDGALVEPLVPDSEGTTYRSKSLTLTAGHTYTLKVSAPGYESVEATEMLPHPPHATASGRLLPERANPDVPWYDFYEVTVALDDPPGQSNFYTLSLDRIEYANGRVIPGPSGSTSFRSADPVLQDGATGVTVSLPELRYEIAQFSDRAIEGRRYEMRLIAQVIRNDRYPFQNENEPLADRIEYVVKVRCVNESYYRYLIALSLAEDESPLAEPVHLPSNVRGGLGLFAAVNELAVKAFDIKVPQSVESVGSSRY